MGDLLDRQLIDRRDLVWAIENAYSPDVRSAAFTLLATWLGQPFTRETALRYGPEVVEGDNYLEKQEWNLTLSALTYALIASWIGMLLGLWWLSRYLDLLARTNSWLVTTIAAIVVLLGLLLLYSPVAWFARRRWKQQLANSRAARVGLDGENWIVDQARAALDSRWTVFRNVHLSSSPKYAPAFRLSNLFFPAQQTGTGDIDVVLVGPPGVWVLEVKTYRSAIRVHDRTWERLAGSAWKPLDTDPVRQVRGNARDLRHFLERKPYDVTLHVNAVVVLAHLQRRENIGPANEPIWNYNEVRQNLAALNELDTLLSVKEREAIVAALRTTVSKQAPESLGT